MSAKYVSLTDRLAEVPWIAKQKFHTCDGFKYRRGPKPCNNSASLLYVRPNNESLHLCVFHAAAEFDYELNDGHYGNKRAFEYNKLGNERFIKVRDAKGKIKYVRKETQ